MRQHYAQVEILKVRALFVNGYFLARLWSPASARPSARVLGRCGEGSARAGDDAVGVHEERLQDLVARAGESAPSLYA